MTSDSAALRVFRILAISIGLGSAIFTVLGLPAMAAQFGTLHAGYAWTSILLYAGLPVAAALIAPRVSIRTLRVIAATHATTETSIPTIIYAHDLIFLIYARPTHVELVWG